MKGPVKVVEHGKVLKIVDADGEPIANVHMGLTIDDETRADANLIMKAINKYLSE